MTDEEFKEIFPFPEQRKGQRQVVEAIIKAFEEDDKKHVCLSAPTGAGKSVIAVAVANYLNGGYLLTSQKTLQKQYDDELSLPVLYGRNHYDCNLNFGKHCNQCIGHKQCKPLNKHGCQYLHARNYTLFDSNISVLNYAYAMNIINSQTKYKSNDLREMMPERPLLICDESHNLEQNIINHAMLEFTSFDINRYKLGNIFSIPKNKTSDLKKIQWLLEDIYTKAEEEFATLESELTQTDITSPSYNQLSKLVSYYSDIISKCEIINEEFLLDHNNIVILQDDNEKITFKLLFGKKLFERTLLGKGQKILHMSATLPSKAHYCKTLNLDPPDVSYIKVPSMFPVKNRPIIYMPVGKMSYAEKSKTFPKILAKVDKILDKYADVGGIIHTQSNALTEDIISKSKHANRFIFPKGKDRQNMIDMYTDLNMKGDNKVLISPSLHEGLNLEGPELGSFNIICKMPFPAFNDAWVKKRMKADDKWYNEETVLKIVQSTGRTTRSKDDKSVSFILDECFTNVYKYNKSCFPLYWQQSLIKK